MTTYIGRRVLLALPTILGITFIIFLAVRFIPGDVVDQLTAGSFGAASPEFRAALREQYNLNDSIVRQYVDWLADLARLDFGTSILSGRPVAEDLKFRLPITFELGFLALLFSLCISIPVGVLSAVKQNSIWDYIARSAAVGALAIPSFWLGLLVLIYGFKWFGWTPPLRYQTWRSDPVEHIKIMAVPALILAVALAGTVTRLTRSMMLEVLRQDYVRTARAKGLPGRTVVLRHALRSALLPIITVVGLQASVVISGTVILEQMFSLPGMGQYLVESISSRDYPLVQAVVLLTAVAVVMTNLVVDVAYAILDPRIRYGR